IKLAGGFPKYHIPAIPCLAICIALALKDIGGKLKPIEFQSIGNWMSILLFGTLTSGLLIFGYWFTSKKYHTSLPKENLFYFLMGFGLSVIFPLMFLLKKTIPSTRHYLVLSAALILGGFSYGFLVINDTWLNSRYHLRDNLPAAVLSDWAQAALVIHDEAHPTEFDKESKQYDGGAWPTLRRFFYLLNIIPLATMGISVLATSMWHWKTIIPKLATATVLMSLGMALALSVKQTFSDYSVSYFYGDKGIKDAALYLNQKGWEGMFVAEGEVAYYMNNKNYVEIDRYMQARRIHDAEGELFIDAQDIPLEPIRLLIARRWIEDYWPGQDYETTKEIGSFRIIEYKPRSKKVQKS
ncbi:MAG TPA: hypothetical protein VGY77_04535, partial [Gemmataceae bacterium]|nr:hypothetical protein [Gemmataceae bacterium]